MAPALANDLVSGCEWDEMRETFHRHAVAVSDIVLHGFGEAQKLRHELVPQVAGSFTDAL
jgi:hypothetical protein